jgi:hypothetical protein
MAEAWSHDPCSSRQRWACDAAEDVSVRQPAAWRSARLVSTAWHGAVRSDWRGGWYSAALAPLYHFEPAEIEDHVEASLRLVLQRPNAD